MNVSHNNILSRSFSPGFVHAFVCTLSYSHYKCVSVVLEYNIYTSRVEGLLLHKHITIDMSSHPRAANAFALRAILGESSSSSSDNEVVLEADDVHEIKSNDEEQLSYDDTESEDADNLQVEINPADLHEQDDINRFTDSNGNVWVTPNEGMSGRVNAANILRPSPGITRWATQRIGENSVLDCFNLLFIKCKSIYYVH